MENSWKQGLFLMIKSNNGFTSQVRTSEEQSRCSQQNHIYRTWWELFLLVAGACRIGASLSPFSFAFHFIIFVCVSAGVHLPVCTAVIAVTALWCRHT